MRQPEVIPQQVATAAELLVHRARLELQQALGIAIQAELPLENVAQRLDGAEGRAWSRLCTLFGLTQPECDLLALAIAVAIEPALGPLVATLQSAEGRWLPTEPLIKRLHGHPADPIWRPTSPLAIWRLLTVVRTAAGEPEGYQADRAVVDWMFGHLSLDAELVLALDSAEPGPVPSEWPVIETAGRLDHALSRGGGGLRLLVQGRDSSAQSSFAAAVAAALERRALTVDPSLIPATDWVEAFMLAQRFALFADTALIWRQAGPAWPIKIPVAPLQFLCTPPGESPPPRDGLTDLRLALPDPGLDSKAALIRHLIPTMAAEAPRLAAMPGLLLGDLIAVAHSAPRHPDEAASELRARARTRMTGAGHVVDPVFGWHDLVAPEALVRQLRRIAFEARMRPLLMENPETQRVYQRSASLTALFCGPPGVGKSMAAHVIAHDLGANLLVIDLGATSSKYIGETAKNLTEAFAQASASGAALIFEEADALFAKRTEVQSSNDRHANTDTSHLLQLLEAHDGLVLLSTNRRANIDPAFIRRLAHVVEFSKPGPTHRQTLWKRMLLTLGTDPEPLSEPIAQLAAAHDCSPAQIKRAALTAFYSALEASRSIEASDLTMAVGQELAKEGRSAPPAETKPTRRQRSSRYV